MGDMSGPRIFLSPPHLGEVEWELTQEAFASNWIAPLGPHVDAFEREFADIVGNSGLLDEGSLLSGKGASSAGISDPLLGTSNQSPVTNNPPPLHAAALSSGTAALHLALILAGVGPGDEVLCSTFTFSASANPIVYLGAKPVFIDSETRSWNLDPALLAEWLQVRARRGKVPKALVLVHLYGQAADLDLILAVCATYGVKVIEDAAEALGATYRGQPVGGRAWAGIFSFNGNKIITTSGGGMLVSRDGAMIDRARFLASQARDPAPHYQHSHIGYNYRLSNVLAAIGRGQLRHLEQRVAARRRNFAYYQEAFKDLPGMGFMPEADYGTSNRWLSCLTIDPVVAGTDREAVRLALAEDNIEARPLWKPLHLQPVFAESEFVGGTVAEDLFALGLCLPSGSSLAEADLERVAVVVRRVFARRSAVTG